MKENIIFALFLLLGTSVFAQKENPRGLYRLQKFGYDKTKEQVKAPYEQYKYCTDSCIITIAKPWGDFFRFNKNDGDMLPNYTGKKKCGKDGHGSQIFDSNNNGFAFRWYSTAQGLKIFPYNQFVTEYYTKDSIDENLEQLIKIIKCSSHLDSTKIHGVWQCLGGVDHNGKLYPVNDIYYEGNDVYRLFTSAGSAMIFIDGYALNAKVCNMDYKAEDCLIETFGKYYREKYEIYWIDNNTFALTKHVGKIYTTELWTRSGLPSLAKSMVCTDGCLEKNIYDPYLMTKEQLQQYARTCKDGDVALYMQNIYKTRFNEPLIPDVAHSMVKNNGSHSISIEISDGTIISPTIEDKDNVCLMASFPGGKRALLEYLISHVKYPAIAEENKIQGKVEGSFRVNEHGEIIDVQIPKKVDPSLDKEVKRVIKSMPYWIPGKVNGKSSIEQHNISVLFKLKDREPRGVECPILRCE